MKRRRQSVFVLILSVLVLSIAAPNAYAEDGEFTHKSAFAIRATPIGVSLFSDTGYRQPLWQNPESALFANTHITAGATTSLSPAFAWGGPYVEFLPIAVLQLRASAQYMNFFGNLGYLYRSGEEALDWSSEALAASRTDNLGEASSGWLILAQATPQIRLGRVVATAETTVHWVQMDLETPYYEPYYDLAFAPTDFFWITRPTIGYLIGKDLSKSYLLLGARWERAMTRETEITRDTAGVVFSWKLPSTWIAWGSPTLAGFGGVFIDHPNRGRISPYFGTQAVVQF